MTIKIATLDPSLSATHITKQLMGDTTLLLLAHTQELTKLQCWLDTLTERNKHLRWLIKDNIFSFRSSWIAAWWDHQASRGNKTHFLFSSTLSLCHWFYTLVVDWCSQSVLLLSTSCWQRNTEKKKSKKSQPWKKTAMVTLPDHFTVLLNLLRSQYFASSLHIWLQNWPGNAADSTDWPEICSCAYHREPL